ncbi:MAG: hypothetical protein HFH31_03900 [Bacilli bacterium]|nr:hypothetical protein [Bacilli bacterium]
MQRERDDIRKKIDLLIRKGVHDNAQYYIREAFRLKIETLLGHFIYDLFLV